MFYWYSCLCRDIYNLCTSKRYIQPIVWTWVMSASQVIITRVHLGKDYCFLLNLASKIEAITKLNDMAVCFWWVKMAMLSLLTSLFTEPHLFRESQSKLDREGIICSQGIAGGFVPSSSEYLQGWRFHKFFEQLSGDFFSLYLRRIYCLAGCVH